MNGQRVRTARRAKDWTGEKLGKALGVTKITVSRWENNVTEPDDAMKKQIAALLGVSVAYLMGDEDADKEASTEIPNNSAAHEMLSEQSSLSITDIAAFTDRIRSDARHIKIYDRALIAHMLRNCIEALEDMSEDLSTDGGLERVVNGENDSIK